MSSKHECLHCECVVQCSAGSSAHYLYLNKGLFICCRKYLFRFNWDLVRSESETAKTSPTIMPCVDVTSGGAVGGQNGIGTGCERRSGYCVIQQQITYRESGSKARHSAPG